jgi:hypothetical protein
MTQYRLTMEGVYPNGRTWSFRQHYSSAASLATIIADWSNAWTTAWTTATTGLATVYTTGTVLNNFTAAVLTGTPYREGLKSVNPVSHAGTVSGDSLPPQTAILISRRSVEVGARNRGRTYLPAPAESTQVDGEMDTTNAGNVSTSINAVRIALVSAGHTPVIYNTKVSTADPVIQTNKTITLEEVDRILRSQRRRQEKTRAVYV